MAQFLPSIVNVFEGVAKYKKELKKKANPNRHKTL